MYLSDIDLVVARDFNKGKEILENAQIVAPFDSFLTSNIMSSYAVNYYLNEKGVLYREYRSYEHVKYVLFEVHNPYVLSQFNINKSTGGR